MKKLTSGQSNYLGSILRLSEKGPVRISDLASKLGVKKPSASRAVKGLSGAGLIKHEHYGNIELTGSGEKAGREILRKEQCLEKLFAEVLGMDPGQADMEAREIGNRLSDEVNIRLETMIDFALSSDAWIKRLQYRIEAKK